MVEDAGRTRAGAKGDGSWGGEARYRCYVPFSLFRVHRGRMHFSSASGRRERSKIGRRREV
jgi:hypothetical protein